MAGVERISGGRENKGGGGIGKLGGGGRDVLHCFSSSSSLSLGSSYDITTATAKMT